MIYHSLVSEADRASVSGLAHDSNFMTRTTEQTYAILNPLEGKPLIKKADIEDSVFFNLGAREKAKSSLAVVQSNKEMPSFSKFFARCKEIATIITKNFVITVVHQGKSTPSYIPVIYSHNSSIISIPYSMFSTYLRPSQKIVQSLPFSDFNSINALNDSTCITIFFETEVSYDARL